MTLLQAFLILSAGCTGIVLCVLEIFFMRIFLNKKLKKDPDSRLKKWEYLYAVPLVLLFCLAPPFGYIISLAFLYRILNLIFRFQKDLYYEAMDNYEDRENGNWIFSIWFFIRTHFVFTCKKKSSRKNRAIFPMPQLYFRIPLTITIRLSWWKWKISFYYIHRPPIIITLSNHTGHSIQSVMFMSPKEKQDILDAYPRHDVEYRMLEKLTELYQKYNEQLIAEGKIYAKEIQHYTDSPQGTHLEADAKGRLDVLQQLRGDLVGMLLTISDDQNTVKFGNDSGKFVVGGNCDLCMIQKRTDLCRKVPCDPTKRSDNGNGHFKKIE